MLGSKDVQILDKGANTSLSLGRVPGGQVTRPSAHCHIGLPRAPHSERDALKSSKEDGDAFKKTAVSGIRLNPCDLLCGSEGTRADRWVQGHSARARDGRRQGPSARRV